MSLFWDIKQVKAVVCRKNLTFIFHHSGTKQEKERNAGAVHTKYTERGIKYGFGTKTESFTRCHVFEQVSISKSIYHSDLKFPAQRPT